MTHQFLELQDEDALFDYTNGENDALILDTPALNSYYYLMGWHDTKIKIEKGELTALTDTLTDSLSDTEINEIEVF